jgi:c-di-GMP-binding flagellar brake protein YcgR
MEPSPGTTNPEERRRAVRYPIEAQVTIHTKSGQALTAKAVNISSSGMLLQLSQPFPLDPGDEVTVEVDLPNEPDQALASWGLGTVVRLDGLNSAVHLSAGHFDWASFGGTDQ